MSAITPTVESLAALAKKLPPADRARLIEQVAASLAEEPPAAPARKPARSLYGMWAGVSVSEEDIAEARHEMFRDFPREDVA